MYTRFNILAQKQSSVHFALVAYFCVFVCLFLIMTGLVEFLAVLYFVEGEGTEYLLVLLYSAVFFVSVASLFLFAYNTRGVTIASLILSAYTWVYDLFGFCFVVAWVFFKPLSINKNIYIWDEISLDLNLFPIIGEFYFVIIFFSFLGTFLANFSLALVDAYRKRGRPILQKVSNITQSALKYVLILS